MRKLVGSQAELRVVLGLIAPGAPNLTRFPVPKRADGACLNCVHQRGATRRAERMRRARIPRPCKQLVGEAGALVDVLRVQRAGRATITILALRSGESRALPPEGSILPIYRSGDVGLDHPCVRAVRLESGYCRELLGGRTRGRVPTSRAFYHPRPGRSAGGTPRRRLLFNRRAPSPGESGCMSRSFAVRP